MLGLGPMGVLSLPQSWGFSLGLHRLWVLLRGPDVSPPPHCDEASATA